MKTLLSVLLFALFSAHTSLVFASNKDAQFFRDVDALAINIYHESRGLKEANGDKGWRTIAGAVFVRLKDPRFPETVEKIIYSHPPGRDCAFSWYCDEKSDVPTERNVYGQDSISTEELFFFHINPCEAHTRSSNRPL